MKITKGDYVGSPCIQVHLKDGVHLDLDWNTRKLGWSLWFGSRALGRRNDPPRRWHDFTVCLDVRAPLGEPNRLEFSFLNYFVTVGLSPGMGVQKWDWRKSEWTYDWAWFTVHPLDHRERWLAAHPGEASQRAAHRRATGGRWAGPA